MMRLLHVISAQARAVFTLDLRSLALFRVGLGLMVLLDAAWRLPDVGVFYTDAGMHPRARVHAPSLYMLDGSEAFATALLVLTAVCGAVLMLGWRTRLFTILSWALVVSVQHRNPSLNTGADAVLVMLLAFACFLPLGARYALDARRRPDKAPADDAAFTWATAALVLQIVVIYLFNVVNKDTPRWHDGTAAFIALHIDEHATTFGVWLREHARFLMKPLTWGTLLAEASALLLLVPWRAPWLRLAAFAALWGLHLGFAATMYLGLFPWVCMVAWLAVLPPLAWQRGPLARLAQRLDPRMPPATGPKARTPWWLAPVVVALVVSQAWANAAHSWKIPRYPAKVARAVSAVRFHSTWVMFASPGINDGWFVIPGTLASGREVDLYKASHEDFEGPGPRVTFKKPRSVANTYPTARWRKIWMSASSPKSRHGVRRAFAEWMCREWNARHAPGDDALVSLRIVYMLEKTRKNATPMKPKQVELLEHTCRP